MSGTRRLYYAVAKAGWYTSCVSVPLITLAGAFYYRPLPDLESEDWGGPSHYKPKKVTAKQKEKRNNPSFSKEAKMERFLNGEGKEIPQDLIEKLLKYGYSVSRYVVLNTINLVINVGMNSNLYNSFRSIKDERYEYLLSSIQKRDKDEALLTVSNHCSTIDDPTLFGAFLPTYMTYSPFQYDKIRWTLCSQEICFKNDFVGSLFGAGKVLPIKRGAGISQPLLHAFALKITDCEWVHIFPEGKIVQSGSLGSKYFGTRTEERALEIGKLKWGVGKLIAHSSVPIRVIPFHHLGMEGIVPQKKTGETIYKRPLGGCDVKFRVGGRIFFDDIINEYEAAHGKLYKYGTGKGREDILKDREKWKKLGHEKHEQELYSRITRRIEVALEELEHESKMDKDQIVQNIYANLIEEL